MLIYNTVMFEVKEMKIEYTGNLDTVMTTIKHIMVDKKIKQKDIALRTGLSVQTISNLLACRRDGITLDTLRVLCNAVGCKLYIDISD